MGNTDLSVSSEKTVLIVDDDKGVREFLEIIVGKEGFRVDTAGDGEEALTKTRAVSPDLILLDLMLPKSGGYEVVHELQGEETADIPIIIMTGRIMDQSTSEMIMREPNVKDYLEKPVKTALLAALMHKILNTRPPAK